MSDRRDPGQTTPGTRRDDTTRTESPEPLELIDECLATLPDDDPRQKLLYRIRHRLLQDEVAHQQRDAELQKLTGVVEKLTAPANRIGMLLDIPSEGASRILVGGAEYYANVDPRVAAGELKIGVQVLVNEAYVVIQVLGYDRNGPVMRIGSLLPDGRIRMDQEGGHQGLVLQRSSELQDVDLKAGDHVRIDPGLRMAIERLTDPRADAHVLAEVPNVTWDQIGGQQAAITAIRRSIEYPLLHAATFQRYRFAQPKGFLLHGPPGCGKTLIGQATAASLASLARAAADDEGDADNGRPPITGGEFLHVKGPEILNMWLGESERMVRDLFVQARERRQRGLLPFIFIDEAESILGTRRSLRSFNISNTLVPMFCAEMDGIESLQDVVIILASNRPDLIDPAVLRPGRIDRKIKVSRPGREEAAEILGVYLSKDLPLDPGLLAEHGDDPEAASRTLIRETVSTLFQRTDENRLLSIRLRSGQREVLYRGDLVSGAILASIAQRAKERAIERAIEATEGGAKGKESDGLRLDDLRGAIQAEYQEGEILPPDDAAEEWLKLLDYYPQQVVGVTSFRKGRGGDERPVSQII